MSQSVYRPRTATALIVANMIGTGVFTSLGFQLMDIGTGFPILMLWFVGGVAALCGALSYAELGTRLPRSGGEYNFLGQIYHPAAGFVSGWVSATIGFAAPIAAVALAFSDYSGAVFPALGHETTKTAVALALVLSMSLLHTRSHRLSGGSQTAFTAVKLVLILLFCIAGLTLVKTPQNVSFLPQEGDMAALLSPAFAVSLIYVSYAYTGWNAATYITGELETPQKSLPIILMTGTLVVAALYILLHIVFLRAAPMEAMRGEVEIGYIAARGIFGDGGGRIAGGMLALLLISTVSAMTLAGPRALQAIGQDFRALSWLSRTNKDAVPVNAVWTQTLIAAFFVMTQTFETIIVFAGSLLAFNSLLAVLGLFVLRRKQGVSDIAFHVPLYPVLPLVYLAITGFTLIYIAATAPGTVVAGLVLIAAGLLFYVVSRKLGRG
ncbi:MAG: APC family permease [Pseudomonadota bacterium]